MRDRLLLLVLLCASTVFARDVEQAREAVRQFLLSAPEAQSQHRAPTLTRPELVYTKTSTTTSNVLYYVFTQGPDKGFTLVSADDALPAIAGYTTQGHFDANHLPSNFAAYLADYERALTLATPEQKALYAAYRRSAAPKEAVEPLITTHWNQWYPYNRLCPLSPEGNPTYTGCVATAMAQIINYHRYPDHLLNDIPAYTTRTDKTDVEGIAAGLVFDWDHMADYYDGTQPEAENQAVATLLNAVGRSVEMDYTEKGSAAYSTDAAQAFVEYFGMDPELIRVVYRESVNFPQWDEMLHEELAAHRPIYFSGNDGKFSHAFVVHGYRDGLYAVNWGWAGTYDGYFDVTLMQYRTPDDHYAGRQEAILGITPDNGTVDPCASLVAYQGKALLGEATADNGYADIDLRDVVFYNMAYDDVARYVAVGVMDDDGSIYPVSDTRYITIRACTDEWIYIAQVSFTISLPTDEDKIYELFFIESSDEETWVPTMYNWTWPQSFTLEVQDGQLSRATYALSASVSPAVEDGLLRAGGDNVMLLHVENAGQAEYYGFVKVKVAPEGELEPEDYCATPSPTVRGATTKDCTFTFKPTKEGNYTFWIYDRDDNLIGTTTLSCITADIRPQLSFEACRIVPATETMGYGDYGGEDLLMPVVNTTRPEVEFVVRNNGFRFAGTFLLSFYKPQGSWSGPIVYIDFPEGLTTLRYPLEGQPGQTVGAMLLGSSSDDGPVDIADLVDGNLYKCKSSGRQLLLRNGALAHIADDAVDAIAMPSLSSPLSVWTGKGQLCLTANASTSAKVFAVSGQCVATLRLRPQQTATLALPRGIYLVEGRKYAVQ